MQKNYTSLDAIPLILFLFGRHRQPNEAPLLKAKLCIMLFHNNICFLILRVCNCYTSYLWTKNQTNLSSTLEATITIHWEGCVILLLSYERIIKCILINIIFSFQWLQNVEVNPLMDLPHCPSEVRRKSSRLPIVFCGKKWLTWR